MPISKPIIIVGSGRCGSTAFHRLLATHSEVMWLSALCDRYPDMPGRNRFAVSALGNPLVRRLLGRRVRPGECYRFWDRHAYGFSSPCRDLVRADVTARVKRQVRAALEPMLTPTRNRLLLKITGWPRLGYLQEIFEDAKFIHIVRDGRAVASSLLHVDFWRGWQGPQGWRAGLLSPEDQMLWEQYNRSFVALAGLEWKIQMRAFQAAQPSIDPESFCEIKYEAFCEQPLDTCRRALDFAELREPPHFEQQVRAAAIKNSDRWRHDLTSSQRDVLEALLYDDLRHYGYEVPQQESDTPALSGGLGI
jgi:omega-hydroxy-beta-dihydromenaquinone-9 sulfotransferase